jgi:predicted HTH domain antitoxin
MMLRLHEETVMHTLSLDYPDELLLTTGKSPDELEDELALLLGVKLFELRRLSLGKAAELARRSKMNFLFELGRLGVAAIDLDEDQIADELRDD